MRTLAAPLLALSLLLAPPASACRHDGDCGSFSLGTGGGVEDPARWAPRHDSRLARYVITTRDGKVDLLLTPTAVAFQLSDQKMNSLENKLRDAQYEGEDNPISDAVKTAVLAGVRVLLKHSAECPIRDLRDVDYRNGSLVFVTRDGDRVFDQLEINDSELVAAFPEREARAFVREFRRLKAAHP
jgi:hypothetical protein